MIRIAIGADHRGYASKEYIKKELTSVHGREIKWIDVGALNDERSDYPVFAIAASKEILAGNADYGILLCGSAVGMAIAANRFHGIYAGVAWNSDSARKGKEDDNTNVLVLPSDFVSSQEMVPIITVWLMAEFQAGRYQERIDLIDRI